MKSKRLIGMLLTSALFLSACGFFPDPVDPNQPPAENGETTREGETDGQDEESSIVEVQIDSEYYRPVVREDGTYAPSQSRGITRRLNSNLNMRTFESDLMRHAHRHFPTSDHFFQEGQFIPSATINSWLRRQEPIEEDEDIDDDEQNEEAADTTEASEDLGLNPEDNSGADSEERNPIYLSSILEHNFYEQTEEGLQLAGISIGLAMNSVDYYGDNRDQEQVIPLDELLEEGQDMADQIVSYLREMEDLADVPIMVALFEQSRRDSLAPGTYFAEGLSDGGSDSVNSWNRINEDRLVFPLEGMQSAEGNSFANFRSEVEGFFPNISGITGVGHYVEEQLVHLQIDVMTQFYGKGEIIAFTQFVNEAASNFLPGNVPVEIRLESLNGMEAFLHRENDEDDYEVFIFN